MKNGDLVRPFMISGDGIKTYRDPYLYVIVRDDHHNGTSALITNCKEMCIVSKNQLEKFVPKTPFNYE
jgi:hypothetical protein